MENISVQLKKRFVTDCQLPIKLFQEPYFSKRLELFDRYFDTLSRWTTFTHMLEAYRNEEEYFAEYNRVKDGAIEFIKNSEGYLRFNNFDMDVVATFTGFNAQGFPNKDIFHASNIGKRFVSLDMIKANFSSLRHFSTDIFDNAETWKQFLGKFTDNEYLLSSKYIREVILGNCNCKRHITYERYLMSCILYWLIAHDVDPKLVVFFSNDEVILDVTNVTDSYDKYELMSTVKECVHECSDVQHESAPNVPLRLEEFTLKGIMNTKTGKILGYIKQFDDDKVDFKCLNHITYPFVIRALNDEPIQDSDKIFEHEGQLAQFVDVPMIAIISTT